MGAFFSTVANAAHKKADLMRQQAHDANSGQIEVYKGVLANPNSTPDQRQFAADSLNKLYAIKPADSPFHKVLGVLNHVGQKISGQPAAPAQGAAPAQPTSPAQQPNELDSQAAAAPAGNELESNPPPAPKSLPPISFDPGGAGGATSSPDQATNLTGAGSDTVHPSLGRRILGGVGKGLSTIAGGVQSGLSALTEPTGLSPTVPIEASQIPSPVLPGLKFDTQNLINGSDLQTTDMDRFGNQVDPNKKYVAAPDPHGDVTIGGRRVSIQPFTPKPSMMAPRSIGATMSLDNARQLETAGTPILGPNGKPYDLTKVPKDITFKAVGLPGGGIGYILGTEKQVERTFDNVKHIVGEFDQIDPSKYIATGEARVPTTHEQLVTDVNTGETRAVPLTTTPGGAKVGPRVLPGNPSQPSLTPLPAPAAHAPAASGASPAARPTQLPTPSAGGAGRVVPGVVPTGQAKGLRDRNTALNGTTTALENVLRPDETGKNYLDLFKPENSGERKKVADFIRLNDEIAEGDYKDRASENGISSLASFTLGVPGMVASAKNEQLTKAYTALKSDPAAVRAVADYYNLIGMIGGMRKATGANASQWSFSNLKQEVPSPLLDSSYQGVLAKMHNIANEVNSNAKPNLSSRPFDMNLLNVAPHESQHVKVYNRVTGRME